MIKIGIVGIGFMGRIHYLAAQRLTGGTVAAVCSRDAAKIAGDWSRTRGNFGPEPGLVDLTGIAKYSAFEELLADPEIDLVDICNTTAHHRQTAIRALRAGKHVLVEKAIALTVEQADEMLAVSRETGKLLMVAHVLPFFPEFRCAAEIVHSGQYGQLLGAHFTRVIAKPDWSAEIGDSAATGGPAVDLHIHDTHFIGLLAGMPEAVFSVGREENGAVNYLSTSYLYGPGGPAITCNSGALAMPGRPFVHGFEIFLEGATLSHSSSGNLPLNVIKKDGSVDVPILVGGGDPIAAFADELQAAVDGVENGIEPAWLSGMLARNALALCHKECESVRTGRVVETI